MFALFLITVSFIVFTIVGIRTLSKGTSTIRLGVLLTSATVLLNCFSTVNTGITEVVRIHSSISTLFSIGYREEMIQKQINELRRVQDMIDKLADKYGTSVTIHMQDGLFIRSLIANGGNLKGIGEGEAANSQKLEMLIQKQTLMASQINEKIQQSYGEEFNSYNRRLLQLENDPFSGMIVRWYRKHFIISDYIYSDNLRLN